MHAAQHPMCEGSCCQLCALPVPPSFLQTLVQSNTRKALERLLRAAPQGLPDNNAVGHLQVGGHSMWASGAHNLQEQLRLL